ncbi:MAG: hypothetical protein B7Z13_11800 [Caulobacterales bacterium 32-67-6]|nr:MAG: hypothetical protein B7Z13_11800 [Caulobacterales bacterium 32-67-6]
MVVLALPVLRILQRRRSYLVGVTDLALALHQTVGMKPGEGPGAAASLIVPRRMTYDRRMSF